MSRTSRGRRVTRAAAAALLALTASGALPAAADERADLKRRQREARAALEALVSQEGDVLAAIDTIDQQVSIEEAAVDAAEKKVTGTEKALEFVRADLARTDAALKKRRAALAPRLVVRYKLGRTGYFPVLLTSGSVAEFRRRQRLLAQVVRADLAALQEIRRLEKMLVAQRQKLETGHTELATLRESAAARLAALREARLERQATLDVVREERRMRERVIVQLRRAEQRLTGLVEGFGRGGGAGRGFAALRGKLPMPTAGAIELGFGTHRDPQYETVTVHKGVDIRAPRGAKVKAVAPGRVAHAGWLRGYGNLVIVSHGDAYFTLMAHLDRIEVTKGEAVEAGTTVGLVGDTGSLKGAYLYFEIRKGGRALDPKAWFR